MVHASLGRGVHCITYTYSYIHVHVHVCNSMYVIPAVSTCFSAPEYGIKLEDGASHAHSHRVPQREQQGRLLPAVRREEDHQRTARQHHQGGWVGLWHQVGGAMVSGPSCVVMGV